MEMQAKIHVLCFYFLQANKNLLENINLFADKLKNHLKDNISLPFNIDIDGSIIRIIFNKNDILVIPTHEFTA